MASLICCFVHRKEVWHHRVVVFTGNRCHHCVVVFTGKKYVIIVLLCLQERSMSSLCCVHRKEVWHHHVVVFTGKKYGIIDMLLCSQERSMASLCCCVHRKEVWHHRVVVFGGKKCGIINSDRKKEIISLVRRTSVTSKLVVRHSHHLSNK